MQNKGKEFGGFLEMEQFRGEEYYSDLHKLNLGRTALVWLLTHIDHDRIFIPEYICDTVTESVRRANFNYVSYRLDENLKPIWGDDVEPRDNDIFYLVNYFGQLTEEEILYWRDRFTKVIVDNAHAFYNHPIPGVHTLYSPRKFFGIPDGAYVASDIGATDAELEQDFSVNRVNYLVGRLEESANKYYSSSKAAEESFSMEKPKRMSAFTQNILKAVDYEYIKKKRCRNYTVLKELLKGDNPFNRRDPVCPYLFPYYHEDGAGLRKYLIENKIYVPVIWEHLIDEEHKGSNEYDWSKNMVFLPIDQRYDEEDMKIIADAISDY